MTTKAHKLLTGTDLHEPKGVASATAGKVYVSDGAGSGVWTTINTDVAFTTGDVKLTYKTVADANWLMMDDTTIGSATSGATHASALYQDLFRLIWDNVPSAWTTVAASRGGSSAADWAANKTITLPKTLGRALAIAGAGASLTSRALGQYLGVESLTLTAGHIPSLTSSAVNSISVTSGAAVLQAGGGITQVTAAGAPAGITYVSPTNAVLVSSGNNTITVNYTNGSPTAISTMTPSAFLNVMVKI